jgi:hypothetical protein
MRQCGDCQLCCKLLPVKSLAKPASARCQHQRVGKGCMVYAKLWGVAPECKLWNCRWLGNDDMDELRRPDRSHYVVDIMPDFVTATTHNGERVSMEVVQIWVDPDYPDAHRDPALRAWLIRKNKIGLIRYSDREAITLFPPAMMDTGQWFERRSNLSREAPHTAAQVVAALGKLEVNLGGAR